MSHGNVGEFTVLKNGFAIPLLLTALSIALLGADNSIGTWKRNVEKSTTTNSSNPIVDLTMKLEAVDGGRKETVTGVRKDGTKMTGGFVAKYDGKDYAVTGSAFDRISIRQIDANTFETTAKSSTGKHHSKSSMVVSADGKTLTFKTTGVDAEGKEFTSVSVYDRQ